MVPYDARVLSRLGKRRFVMVHALTRRTGGQVIVDTLRAQGIDRVFGVPGESFLPILDALHDTPDVAFTVCRHEGGAAMMAEADGKLTGRPGVAVVTRAPGATNASSGVHVAMQDSTPMLLLVGQIARGERDREAFQELDYRRVFAPMAKWVAEVDDAARLPEYLGRAVRVAMQGRPGPVVLALPEDVLTATTCTLDVPRVAPVRPHPDPDAMQDLRARLSVCERPLVIVGGGDWSAETGRDIEVFAAANDLPVACAFRRQHHVDNAHPCFAGDLGLGANPALGQRVREADLLLVVGARLNSVTTGDYTRPTPPIGNQTLVHVHPHAEELGKVYQPDLAVQAGSTAFAAAARALTPIADPPWRGAGAAAHAAYTDWQWPRPIPGQVQMGEIVAWLRDRLPDNAIVCNGAGNYAAFVHRYYRFRRYGTQLAPTSGSMGYGLPAAVAAKLRHPDVPVVAFAGDGCFQMTGQELGTAVQAGAAVVVVVVDNGIYGTIRMHQERAYPGRVSGTELGNPDFVALAAAYGAHAERVTATDAFAPAVERALAAGQPALLHLHLDPEAITPAGTLSGIRGIASG
jgi:acetolactate synthase-1/2/3 large subunit